MRLKGFEPLSPEIWCQRAFLCWRSLCSKNIHLSLKHWSVTHSSGVDKLQAQGRNLKKGRQQKMMNRILVICICNREEREGEKNQHTRLKKRLVRPCGAIRVPLSQLIRYTEMYPLKPYGIYCTTTLFENYQDKKNLLDCCYIKMFGPLDLTRLSSASFLCSYFIKKTRVVFQVVVSLHFISL